MPEVSLGTRVVLDLTQGYVVVTDNFYTSPTLAQKLLQKGINSLERLKPSADQGKIQLLR